jgi:hypothetical protein
MARREETVDIFGGKLRGIGSVGKKEKPASKAGRYYRKTYLLTEELIARIEQVANDHQVGLSELVRWALETVLDEVENRQREIPVTVEERHVIDTD